MNVNLTKNPPVIIGLVAVVVLGIVYFLFFSSPSVPPLSVTTVAGVQGQQSFAALITRLSPITFDTKIFSDARFTSLIDLATPVAPETQGRTDPFAPIGKGSVKTGGT